jgi:hypothetical protein
LKSSLTGLRGAAGGDVAKGQTDGKGGALTDREPWIVPRDKFGVSGRWRRGIGFSELSPRLASSRTTGTALSDIRANAPVLTE